MHQTWFKTTEVRDREKELYIGTTKSPFHGYVCMHLK